MYTYPDNFRAWKVLIAAEYSGAKVKTASNFVFGETNTTKEFLAKFPTGKVRHLSKMLALSCKLTRHFMRYRYQPSKLTTVYAFSRAMPLLTMLPMNSSEEERTPYFNPKSCNGLILPIPMFSQLLALGCSHVLESCNTTRPHLNGPRKTSKRP